MIDDPPAAEVVAEKLAAFGKTAADLSEAIALKSKRREWADMLNPENPLHKENASLRGELQKEIRRYAAAKKKLEAEYQDTIKPIVQRLEDIEQKVYNIRWINPRENLLKTMPPFIREALAKIDSELAPLGQQLYNHKQRIERLRERLTDDSPAATSPDILKGEISDCEVAAELQSRFDTLTREREVLIAGRRAVGLLEPGDVWHYDCARDGNKKTRQ